MDESIREKTPEEQKAAQEAEAQQADLENLRDKQNGGHHKRNDHRAFLLQQKWDFPT